MSQNQWFGTFKVGSNWGPRRPVSTLLLLRLQKHVPRGPSRMHFLVSMVVQKRKAEGCQSADREMQLPGAASLLSGCDVLVIAFLTATDHDQSSGVNAVECERTRRFRRVSRVAIFPCGAAQKHFVIIICIMHQGRLPIPGTLAWAGSRAKLTHGGLQGITCGPRR
jgi:hypothetical protein